MRCGYTERQHLVAHVHLKNPTKTPHRIAHFWNFIKVRSRQSVGDINITYFATVCARCGLFVTALFTELHHTAPHHTAPHRTILQNHNMHRTARLDFVNITKSTGVRSYSVNSYNNSLTPGRTQPTTNGVLWSVSSCKHVRDREVTDKDVSMATAG